MNIAKLIRKGRVTQITKTDGEGNLLLVDYERRSHSRKYGQQYWLKIPRKLDRSNPNP